MGASASIPSTQRVREQLLVTLYNRRHTFEREHEEANTLFQRTADSEMINYNSNEYIDQWIYSLVKEKRITELKKKNSKEENPTDIFDTQEAKGNEGEVFWISKDTLTEIINKQEDQLIAKKLFLLLSCLWLEQQQGNKFQSQWLQNENYHENSCNDKVNRYNNRNSNEKSSRRKVDNSFIKNDEVIQSMEIAIQAEGEIQINLLALKNYLIDSNYEHLSLFRMILKESTDGWNTQNEKKLNNERELDEATFHFSNFARNQKQYQAETDSLQIATQEKQMDHIHTKILHYEKEKSIGKDLTPDGYKLIDHENNFIETLARIQQVKDLIASLEKFLEEQSETTIDTDIFKDQILTSTDDIFNSFRISLDKIVGDFREKSERGKEKKYHTEQILADLMKDMWLEAKKGNHAYFATFERLIHESFKSTSIYSSQNKQEGITEKEAAAISSQLTVQEEEPKIKGNDCLLAQIEKMFYEYFVQKLDEQNNSVLYYTCLCGHTELFNSLLTKIGGIHRIEKNEWLRCRTNALNKYIRQLLDGKSWKEIKLELETTKIEDIKTEDENHDVLISSMFGGDGY